MEDNLHISGIPPPNGTTTNDPSRLYGYTNCAIPNPHIQISYDPHCPRDTRFQDDHNCFFEVPTGSFPHSFPPQLPPLNSYHGVPMGHGAATPHINHANPSQNSLMRSHPSDSPEQPAKFAISGKDNYIYATFLHFRSCLQRYALRNGDSPAPVKLFWKSVHNNIEASSKTAGEFCIRY
ncbi:hypothetical protein M422DRAFT_268862 [Sphaerobolus stellatus SS14]|uniref:Uncharacterized protein n=1 Tax=Sphaerobolus stellatus (strain SS14) TaxID=990650 RepID=A0A0C9TJC2_SPHS4|nr:hypothetical protein M422DRAFT_268862 [Sphaerobolus stellatus SS14]